MSNKLSERPLKHCFYWKFVANPPVLKVAINVPLSRLFDYLPPADGRCPPPGTRVRVPFGKQRLVGLVVAHAADSELPRNRIRRVLEVLDDAPLLGEVDLWLVRFTSDYYHHPVGEVAAAAIPALLRQGRPRNPVLRHVAGTDAARHFDIDALAKKAPRQAELLEVLLDAGGNGVDVETLAEQIPTWRRSFRALAGKALVTEFVMRADDPEPPTRGEATAGPELNGDQQAALDEIRSTTGFHASILDGVTGSGKTEVYLHLISETIASGRQVLVLVPEIGLTPQLVTRLRKRLGIEPALLHSGLSDLERLRSWRQARNGDARLVVGTRSAVFTPLQDAGLFIVDEEHDHSFKQQEGLRYSARDLAIARAKHLDIPIVLGSATPTLEMLHHCEAGNYSHLRLPSRAGAAKPPKLRIVDLGRTASSEGLSELLAEAISEHLAGSGRRTGACAAITAAVPGRSTNIAASAARRCGRSVRAPSDWKTHSCAAIPTAGSCASTATARSARGRWMRRCNVRPAARQTYSSAHKCYPRDIISRISRWWVSSTPTRVFSVPTFAAMSVLLSQSSR
jgi:primosomal protein N' (replication factor Y)